MSKFTDSVKRVSDFMLENSGKNRERGNDDVASKLAGYSDELNEVYDHLLELESLTSALPADLGNIHDLPEELLKELSVSKTDELEDQLVTVINAYGRTASLDQILVGLYRKFRVTQKRRFIQNKLYRMSNVWSVRGKKGVYTITEPLFKNDTDEPDDGGYDASARDMDSEEIPF